MMPAKLHPIVGNPQEEKALEEPFIFKHLIPEAFEISHEIINAFTAIVYKQLSRSWDGYKLKD
jgi:hypothetical protein